MDEFSRIQVTDHERTIFDGFLAPDVFGSIQEIIGALEGHLTEIDVPHLVRLSYLQGPGWFGDTTWAIPSLVLVALWGAIGGNLMFALTLGTLVLPQEVTLIPSYLLFFKLGWLNTYLPLIIPSWFGGGAFLIFLFRQFFLSIPLDLDDAAKIDGASYFQILGWIILPLSRPVLATASILTMIGHWNSFLFPLIVLNDAAKFTLSIGLRYFAVSPSADSKPTDHLLLAGSIMMTVPIVLIFFFGQRYFIRGVVMTGIKG